MKLFAGAALAALMLADLMLAGCASGSLPPAPGAANCPRGQQPMRTAQLFFGRNVGAAPTVSEGDFSAFLDQEITPRFPDGLTVLDGGGQWRGEENQLIREAAKVVLIVIPEDDDRAKLDQVRDAYKRRFRQDSVMLVTQRTCVSF